MVEGCSEMIWSTTEVWCIFMMYVVTTCAYWIAGESDWVVLIPDYRRKSSMGMERHKQAKIYRRYLCNFFFYFSCFDRMYKFTGRMGLQGLRRPI